MTVTNPRGKTDAELATLDLDQLLRAGLGEPDSGRTALFGDGAVAGAIHLDRVGAIPRSITFLAEIVRGGGARYAAELREPLPVPAQAEVIRPWLETAAASVADTDGDERMARWLEAVAAVLALRAGTRQARSTSD